ncbi:DNA polymerase III subunit gamma/tau [Cryobacterium serini]|uniref:DNA polymerase III subunit gamma/tau n=1 Tax=Cryobacterium serini TaxID=1259201 RepID=A0A4R9BTM6_9MICO|nr:DNA polymerase III subunit gamma/tau [Cryobacterium serini]TFD90769.1 DNA polymerase III subunit gamma/tau [Cryobacterium serini]
MNATRDDDALNWAGDDDPTLTSGGTDQAAPEPRGLPEGWTVPQPTTSAQHPAKSDPETAHAVATDGTATGSAAPDGTAASSVALVGMGILAGMYLLYTIGWFIGVARIEKSVTDPVTEFMFSLGAWLAVAAPLAWFGATYWLTTSRPRARLIWLLIGVVVLAPLPFIIGSGASS